MFCAICDDNENDVNLLYKKLMSIKDLILDVDCFNTPMALQDSINSGKSYDCIFMDIELGDSNGINIINNLSLQKEIKVVFISNHEKYVLNSFVVHPYCYLIKPVDGEEINSLLHEIYDDIDDKDILINIVGSQKKYLKYNDIYYLKILNSKKKLLILRTKDNEYLVNGEMTEWVNELNSELFFQTHRSYLVNMIHIHIISNSYCILDNNKKIPISRYKRDNFESTYVKVISRYKTI